MFFLGLGLCIFAWGLRYKLSLYHPPHAASPVIPHAKLLSKNERPDPDAAVSVLATSESPAVNLLSVWLFAGGALSMAALPAMPAARQVPTCPQPKDSLLERTGLHAFFFRPPPTLS